MLAALLPLALSDWLSQTAVSQLAEGLDLQHRVATTRQVSRQVLDRLLAGQSLLSALPDTPPGGADARLPGLHGEHAVFAQVVHLGADGHVAWPAAPGDAGDAHRPAFAAMAEAGRQWLLGTTHPTGLLMPTRPVSSAGAPDAPADPLATSQPPAASPTPVWLAVRTATGSAWLAEFKVEHLWGPVLDAGHDGAWRVARSTTGGNGGHGGEVGPAAPALFTHRAGDYPVEWALPAQGALDGAAIDTEARLFLGGQFFADDWRFVQRSPRPAVQWKGMPLGTWLGGVALATLLGIAWLSRWQIRRALDPLDRLTESTRQPAAGATDARVDVQRDDEIGTLATAFNHMAERLASQFDALAGLTMIDRQILKGAPIDDLATLVLHRLGADVAPAQACIAWLDDGDRLHRAWLDHPPGATAPVRMSDVIALNGQALAAFLALGDHAEVTPAPGSDRAWWPDHLARQHPQRLALPMAPTGRTAAVITLGSLQPLDAESARRARELRDRLSVALATRARENELVHLAHHDSLTGLVNRHGLHQQLDAWLGATVPRLAVLFIDLDHFKDVNDSRGHATGDELLCEASRRLLACAPAGALVARQGGDEFAIVLPGADQANAQAVARAAVQAMAQPFVLRASEHPLSASIGIALCPQDGTQRADLLRRADVALYAAKNEGRGRARLFSPELDEVAQHRVRLLAEMRQALERGEFILHYQPRVLASDRSIRTAEALVRWQHPQRGFLLPGAFIGLAESSGLIDAIGLSVLEQTCAQLARWRERGLVMDRVSVNVSPQQLQSGRLPDAVRDLLDRHRLPGKMLELEVTESLLVGDTHQASAQLARLRAWGITVALDDFGTGYSSMATLRQLPIDVMKVDRSFVTDVCDDQGAQAVASAIIALAQARKLHLVAEGVETTAQATLLGRMGCDELQGFLFSRAVPAEQFERLPGTLKVAPAAREVDQTAVS